MTHDDLHTFDRFQRISKTGAGVEFQVAGVQPGFDAQGGGSHPAVSRQRKSAACALRASADVLQDRPADRDQPMSRYFAKFGGFPGGAALLRFDRNHPDAIAVRLHPDGNETRCPHLVLADMPHLEAIDELHEVDPAEAARVLSDARAWTRREY